MLYLDSAELQVVVGVLVLVWSIMLYYEQNLLIVGIRVLSEMKHLRQVPDPGCASLQIQLVSDIASSCPAHTSQEPIIRCM